MNTKRWIALIAAAVLLFFSLGLNSIMALFKADFFSSFESTFETVDTVAYEMPVEVGDTENRIALLEVNGTILDVGSGSWWEEVEYDHQGFMSQLESILNDETVKGIVLSVNSPGGGVIESAEIHEKLVQIKEERQIPIYVSMDTYAASGGYYISAPADKIFAQKETITGSIGVIMQAFNYEKLAEKVGIEFETIKSGAHKDMFGGSRASTEEELAMLQEIIDESYEDFVDVVEQGRGMTEAEVKKVADGRILGGTQAKRAGLVDEIGQLDDAVAMLRTDYGLEEAELFEYTTTDDSFGSLLGVKVSSFFGPSQEEQLLKKILSTSNSPRMMYLYGDY
ncbi:signal peptide peptidase SppA [Lysinibacillus sp. LZ02]|uniref:signal peptide peptidase SppA n=1 Tax=Lysinibacillus sp. LZ02 TaxID=3420668 RepID=UPI003D35CA66